MIENITNKLTQQLKLIPNIKNDALYSICNAITKEEKGTVRAIKSQILAKNNNENESGESKYNNNIVLTKTKTKNRNSEVSKDHILNLIKKYPELPLFIYSKIYERVEKEYVLNSSLSYNEIEALGLDRDMEFKKLTYSFYDMYMELFDEINKGKYDLEIKKYMKDIIQSYGETWCREMFSLPFDKAKLEETHYWTEEYAKEWLEKQLIENPKLAEKYHWTEETIIKFNKYDREKAKEMVEEGSYIEDYSEVLKNVSEIIANILVLIPRMLDLYNPLPNNTINFIPLIYLMFTYKHYNIFDDRPNEYIREDILKLYIEMKRKQIPLGYIPCNEDNEGIDNIYDIYRKYDERWLGMNDPEKFLYYKEDPTNQD